MMMAISRGQFLSLDIGDELIDNSGQTWLVIDTQKSLWGHTVICQVKGEFRRIYCFLKNRQPNSMKGLIWELRAVPFLVSELCHLQARVQKRPASKTLPETLTYQEALKLVEDFMEQSGIREYCTQICQGACCSGCYRTSHDCYHNEGRRLPCSLHFCSHIAEIIGDVSDNWSWLYRNLVSIVNGKVQNCLGDNRNVYFNVNDAEAQSKFSINKDYFLYLLPSPKITCLIREKIQLRTIKELKRSAKQRTLSLVKS